MSTKIVYKPTEIYQNNEFPKSVVPAMDTGRKSEQHFLSHLFVIHRLLSNFDALLILRSTLNSSGFDFPLFFIYTQPMDLCQN